MASRAASYQGSQGTPSQVAAATGGASAPGSAPAPESIDGGGGDAVAGAKLGTAAGAGKEGVTGGGGTTVAAQAGTEMGCKRGKGHGKGRGKGHAKHGDKVGQTPGQGAPGKGAPEKAGPAPVAEAPGKVAPGPESGKPGSGPTTPPAPESTPAPAPAAAEPAPAPAPAQAPAPAPTAVVAGEESHNGLVPAALTVLGQAHEGGLKLVSALRPGDPGGHGDGSAIDIGNVPLGGRTGTPEMRAFADKMRAAGQAGDPNVGYVIYEQQIAGPHTGWNWTGMEDRGSNTQNHFDHVHVSTNKMK